MQASQRISHYRIPVFLPQSGCRHQCTYCNQREITGYQKPLKPEEIHQIITTHLASLPEKADIEIAFFGGNFTALPWTLQQSYLETAHRYIQEGKVQGIRFSTRPDHIDESCLDIYKEYGVKTIELGAQSLDEEVLEEAQRGHSIEDVRRSSALIRRHGIRLGLQMMIGLPKDNLEKSLRTARQFIEFGAQDVRIYPTLVIENTALAEAFQRGEYKALSMEEAIDWTRRLMLVFEAADVRIIRVGLHPSEGLLSHSAYLAGPFHPAFRQRVETEIWRDVFEKYWGKYPASKDILRLYIASNKLTESIGYQSKNRTYLKQYFYDVKFYPIEENPALKTQGEHVQMEREFWYRIEPYKAKAKANDCYRLPHS